MFRKQRFLCTECFHYDCDFFTAYHDNFPRKAVLKKHGYTCYIPPVPFKFVRRVFLSLNHQYIAYLCTEDGLHYPTSPKSHLFHILHTWSVTLFCLESFPLTKSSIYCLSVHWRWLTLSHITKVPPISHSTHLKCDSVLFGELSSH